MLNARARSIVYPVVLALSLALTTALYVWFFTRDGSVGLWNWQPDYRAPLVIVGVVGVLGPLLALGARSTRRESRRRLRKALSIAAVCVSILAIVVAAGLGGAILVLSGEMADATPPLLQVLDGTGARGVPNLAITFRTPEPSVTTVRYGPAQVAAVSPAALSGQVSDPAPTRSHILVLQDLEPDMQYSWQLDDGPVRSFWTPPGSGALSSTEPRTGDTIYRFAAAGDAHVGSHSLSQEFPVGDAEITRSILATVATDTVPYHAFFAVGDVVDMGIFNEGWERALELFSGPSASVPVRMVTGNHDMLVNGQTHFFGYLSPPGLPYSTGNPRFCRVDAGGAHLLFLSAPWSDSESFSGAQRTWLREQTASLPAEDWIIVLMHSMVFASGADYEGLPWYDPPDMVSEIAPLFVESGVDLVISGHDHQMEFLRKDGVAYAVVGTLGGKLDERFEYISPASEWLDRSHHGFLDVTVRVDRIDLVFRDVDGTALQEFSISA